MKNHIIPYTNIFCFYVVDEFTIKHNKFSLQFALIDYFYMALLIKIVSPRWTLNATMLNIIEELINLMTIKQYTKKITKVYMSIMS